MGETRKEMFMIKYKTWNKDSEQDRNAEVSKGFFSAKSVQEAINSLLYEIRGSKSKRELAYIIQVEKE